MKEYSKALPTGKTVTQKIDGALELIEVISAATVLTAADSGKKYILTAAAGAAITLPALAKWAFKFVTGSAFATTPWTIVAGTNVIFGNALVNGAHVSCASQNTINFIATAETIGDSVDVFCDGTSIFVNGSGVSAGSITFTAP
jgi:hypothetical protein